MFKVQKFQSTGFQIYSNQKEIKYISPSNIRSESVLKLAHPSYIMYSIFLPSSHPWHFIGLSLLGLLKVLLTRISSLRCLRIKGAFSGAREFEKVVSSYRWTPTSIAKYILIPYTPKRCD